MDEEQQKKFKEWVVRERFGGFSPTLTDLVMTAKEAWKACLDANKVEKQEPEPPPTEMVKRLLGRGWRIESTSCRDGGLYSLLDPKDRMHGCLCHEIKSAYRKAFPPKKKIEVEVWYDPSGEHGELRQIPEGGISDDKALSFGWTKGIATFWIEEEQ